MKYLKLYKLYLESIEILDDIKDENSKKTAWSIDKPGIKIVFDITPYSDKSQTPYGKLLIMANTMKDLETRFKNKDWDNELIAATHVGIIFSNGEFLHASSEFYKKEHNGVKYDKEYVKDIIKNPNFYVIFNVGGDEQTIRDIGDEIIERIKENGKDGKSYDWFGIKRIFKTLDNVLDNEEEAEQIDNEDKKDYDKKDIFYCSEFVAYVLVKAGIISIKELNKIKNENDENDPNETKYDINPTELYELVSKIGKKTRN